MTEPWKRATPPTLPPHRALDRIWAVVSSALVGVTAAATLLASATVVPSFAGTRPMGHLSAAPAAVGPAQIESIVTRLSVQRQDRLLASASQIRRVRQGILVTRHRKLARMTASAVRTEISRLRNLSAFLWPTEGGVSSGFGYRLHPILRIRKVHTGTDIGGACNNPVYAAQSGKVIKTGAGYSGGSGNNVRIDHGRIDGRNIQTAYLHMARFIVAVGQQVNKGDLIGYVGSTGLSTACHLHLSLYKDGVESDPLAYLKK